MMSLCSNLRELLSIDEEARTLGIFVAYTIASCSKLEIANDPFKEDINNLFTLVKTKYTLEKLRVDPVVRAYRDFYWRLGIDPTKTRPASEALVRRVLRGKFPRINPIVDAGNIASVMTLVPIGIYDLRKAKPPFRIVLTKGGEIFRPIGSPEEKLRAGIPVLMDSKGIIMHVYPHRDSVDTMVDESTRDVLIVGAGVPGVDAVLVRETVINVVKLLKKLSCESCPDVVVVR